MAQEQAETDPLLPQEPNIEIHVSVQRDVQNKQNFTIK